MRQNQEEKRQPARGQSARVAWRCDLTDYEYMHVTSDMAAAGKASYNDSEAARKQKWSPSVRSTAQKVSLNSMSNIAPDNQEWHPSCQAT